MRKSIKQIILLFIFFFAISDSEATSPPPRPPYWDLIFVNNSGHEVVVVATKYDNQYGSPFVLKNGQSVVYDCAYDYYDKDFALRGWHMVVIMNNLVSLDKLGDRNPEQIKNYAEYPSEDPDGTGRLVYTFTESDYQYVVNYGKQE